MTTALVTGASSGIGLSFARHLAADGHDLVIVARGVDRLEAVAQELRSAYDRDVEVLAADLTDRDQLGRVADRVSDADRPIEVLVNNAGFGLGHGFSGGPLADQEQLLDIHCRAVLVLSHAAAQAMRGRGRGTIINVSSVAGFAAMGTYAAAKAWMTTFSEALAVELTPYGVGVTALCPGFVRTGLHERSSIRMDRLPSFGWLDVDDVVSTALADVARGRVISVPSLRFKAAVLAARHLPRPLVRKASGAINRRRTRG